MILACLPIIRGRPASFCRAENGSCRRHLQSAGTAFLSLCGFQRKCRRARVALGKDRALGVWQCHTQRSSRPYTPKAATVFSSHQSGEAEAVRGGKMIAAVHGALADNWSHKGCQRPPLLFGNKLSGLCPGSCIDHCSELFLPTPFLWNPC